MLNGPVQRLRLETRGNRILVLLDKRSCRSQRNCDSALGGAKLDQRPRPERGRCGSRGGKTDAIQAARLGSRCRAQRMRDWWPASAIFAIAWSMVKLGAFWRGGNSLNDLGRDRLRRENDLSVMMSQSKRFTGN